MGESNHRTRNLGTVFAAATTILVVLLLVVGLICMLFGHKTIKQGYVGVKYQFGKVVETGITPGWHWHVPFIQNIKDVDTREQIYEGTLSAYTRDTQTVEGVEFTVNWSYDTSRLDDIIQTIGLDNIEPKLIVPQVNSVTKNAVGKYKAEELVQNRSVLQEQVEDELRESFSAYGINVHAFNIKNIDFEDSFEDVIRAKVAAEQEALRKQNETVAKEEEAKQRLIAAEAEAEAKKLAADAEAYAIRVIQEQIAASPEYIQLQMVEKWNGQWPQVMGNTVNPFVTLGEGLSYGE